MSGWFTLSSWLIFKDIKGFVSIWGVFICFILEDINGSFDFWGISGWLILKDVDESVDVWGVSCWLMFEDGNNSTDGSIDVLDFLGVGWKNESMVLPGFCFGGP